MKLRLSKPRPRILACPIAQSPGLSRRQPSLAKLALLGMGLSLAGVASGWAQADQTWDVTSADNGWNLTSMNWDAGSTWTQNNNAIFSGVFETVTLNGGPMIFNDLTIFGYTLADGAGSLVLGNDRASTITVGAGTGATTILETIADSANGSSSLTKLGVGTLTLSGLNTYTGPTAIGAGALSVSFLNNSGSAGNTGAGSTMAIGAGTTAGTLIYTGSGETTNRTLDLAGTTGGATITQSGLSGNLKFTGSVSASGAGIKILTLNGSTAGTGEIAGVIADNSGTNTTSVAKSGTGIWTLSGNNTYSGVTTLTQGVLSLTHANALGSTSAGTTQSGTSELRISGGITLAAEAISLSGGGINNAGALRNFSGTNTLTGTVTLAGQTRIASDSGVLNMNAAVAITGPLNFLVTGSGDIAINGAITTGTGVLSKDAMTGQGSGTLTLGGANTYTGYTEVGAGTLRLDYSVNNNSKLSNTAALILGKGTAANDGTVVYAGGTVELSGGTHTEIVSGTTLANYTPASVISRSSGSAMLQLNTITTGLGTGLVFTGSGIATTDNALTNGILGFWARMNVNGVSTWATSGGTADSAIVAFTDYTDINRLGGSVPNLPAGFVRIVNGGTSGNVAISGGLTQVYSLQMDASDGGTIIAPASSFDVLNVGDDAGGAIWQTANAGGLTIGTTPGRGILTSGGTDNTLPAEIRLINDSVANKLIINSVIENNGTDVVSIIVTGPGTVQMNGDNSFTGALTVAGGSTLILTGNNSSRPNNITRSTLVSGGGTLQLQANADNTMAGISSVLSNERIGFDPFVINSGATLQLRSDSAVTFAGGTNFGGLGGATVTIDVNQLTSAGTGQTLSFAPGGTGVTTTTINVTGGNGYRLSLGILNNVSANTTLTLNPTTAALTLASYATTASRNSTLQLSGTALGNLVTGTVLDFTSGTTPGVVSVTKIGSSSWELAGANTYSGPTRVREGTLTLSGNRTAPLAAFIIGDTAGLNATLNITNGNFSSTTTFTLGNVQNTGTVNQTGGALSLTGGNHLLMGNNGVGTVGVYNLSGGSLTIGNNGTRGVVLGTNAETSGYFNLSGTGTLTMPTAVLQLGRADSATGANPIMNTMGVFTQTGGTATVGTLTVGGGLGNPYSGTSGTLNITGGTFTATNFTFFGAADNGSASITIGGTAQVTLPAFPTARGLNNTSTITFDGGTLIPAAASFSYIGGVTNAYVTANGAKFDVATGRDITVSQPLKDASGQNGVLTKLGTGTLTLSGANTYTGATNVTSGTLAVGTGGSISGSSAVKVSNGAVLDVNAFNGSGFDVVAGQTLNNNGTVNGKLNIQGTLSGTGIMTGEVTALGGSVLSPGNSAGNLTFASTSLTLQPGAQYLYEAGVVSDRISLTGNSSSLSLTSWTLQLSGDGGFNPTGMTFVLFDGATGGGAAQINGGLVGTPTIDYGATGWSGGTISYNAVTNDIVVTGVVPEPSSLFSLLTGLGSLLGLQRLRRRAISLRA